MRFHVRSSHSWNRGWGPLAPHGCKAAGRACRDIFAEITAPSLALSKALQMGLLRTSRRKEGWPGSSPILSTPASQSSLIWALEKPLQLINLIRAHSTGNSEEVRSLDQPGPTHFYLVPHNKDDFISLVLTLGASQASKLTGKSRLCMKDISNTQKTVNINKRIPSLKCNLLVRKWVKA